VNITCSASDSLSGVASDTCANVTGPAYAFNLGANAFSATATDKAGNVGSSSTSFTVQVTFDSLCALTRQFCTSATVANSLCSKLTDAKNAAAKGNVQAKTRYLNAYKDQVTKQKGKTLTAAQADTLIRLAGAL